MLKKIFALVVFVFALSVNVYADELSVDTAIDKAIKYSGTLKSIDENIGLAEKNQEDTVRSFVNDTTGYNSLDLASQIRSIRNQISSYELSQDVEKISIGISVKEFFANVLKAEKELELYDISIDIDKKQLAIDGVKYELGLMSASEYSNKTKSYEKTLMDRDAKQISINDAYVSLNTVLGVRDLNTKYELVMDMQYNSFNGASLESTINKALSVSQSVASKQKSYELAKFNYDNMVGLSSNESKEKREAELSQASRSLADAKTNATKDVQNLYNNIIKSENEYKASIIDLEELKKGLEILEIKFKTGRTTQLEIDKQIYSIEQLNASIENQTRSHELLIEKYNNTIIL